MKRKAPLKKSKAKISKKKPLKKSKPVKKIKKLKTKKPPTLKSKSKTPKKIKPSVSTGMNHYEQCVLLAAIINQLRKKHHDFQFVPLPDINSSLFLPLRLMLGEYHFNISEINKATEQLLKSKEFKQFFPTKNFSIQKLFILEQATPETLIGELLDLAGNEARKTIYLMDEDPRHIHKTTLEKHAIKKGMIAHPKGSSGDTHIESPNRHIINQINIRTNPHYFGTQFQNFSSKQRRGRG